MCMCAQSPWCVDEWVDGRGGVAWGACVVLKTTTGAVENDQERHGWLSERHGRWGRSLP